MSDFRNADVTKIGERLRALASEKSLTQTEIARRLSVRATTLNNWFNGVRRPSVDMMPALAELFETTEEFILFGYKRAANDGPATSSADPDVDLEALSPAALLAAARAMRRAIRAHRDASGHDLCWRQPELWALLPDPPKGGQVVPDWPQFLRGCVRYRQSLDDQLPDAPRVAREFDG